VARESYPRTCCLVSSVLRQGKTPLSVSTLNRNEELFDRDAKGILKVAFGHVVAKKSEQRIHFDPLVGPHMSQYARHVTGFVDHSHTLEHLYHVRFDGRKEGVGLNEIILLDHEFVALAGGEHNGQF